MQAIGDSLQWDKSARPVDGFMTFLDSKKLPSSQFKDVMKTLASLDIDGTRPDSDAGFASVAPERAAAAAAAMY